MYIIIILPKMFNQLLYKFHIIDRKLMRVIMSIDLLCLDFEFKLSKMHLSM